MPATGAGCEASRLAVSELSGLEGYLQRTNWAISGPPQAPSSRQWGLAGRCSAATGTANSFNVQKLQGRGFLQRCCGGAESQRVRTLLCGGATRLQAGAECAGACDDAAAERQLFRLH